MRPIKLNITGFGTYCTPTQIDFKKLGNKGLYLVTGKTGSGKTTIFDAISFALFGEASGKNRASSMLRSTYAGPEIPTEVELEFEYREKRYKVKRNPQYERKTKTGDGITTQQADATLYMPDGNVITKTANVTKKVEELLGINREQFNQIVMIAQGDFQKLLLEDTSSREKIFRKLFKTEYYDTLQLALTDQAKVLHTQLSNCGNSLMQYFDGVQENEDNVLALELEEAKKIAVGWEDKIALIEKLIDSDRQKNDKLDKEKNSLNKKLSDINASIKNAEVVENQWKEYEATEFKLADKNNELKECDKALSDAKEFDKEIKQLKKDATLLEEKLPEYDNLEKENSQYEILLDDSNDIAEKIDENNHKLEECCKKLEELKEEEKQYANSGANFEKLKAELEKAEKRNDSLSEIEQALEEKNKLVKTQELKISEYGRAAEAFEKINDIFNQKNKAYFDNMAGILGEQLEENKPCPVCGSLNHPKIAVKAVTAPSKEELDSLKSERDEKEAERTNAATEAQSAKTELNTKNKNIKELLDKQKIKEEELGSEIEKQKKLILELQASIKKEEAAVKRTEELKNQIPEYDEKKKNLEVEKDSLKSKQAEINSALSGCKAKLSEIQKKLTCKTKNEAELKFKELNDRAEKLQKNIDNAKEAVEQCKNEISALEASRNTLKNQLKDKEKVNIEELYDKQAGLEEENEKLEKALKEIYSRISNNESAKENISQAAEELKKIENDYQTVNDLAKTAQGQVTGAKEKIKLETYIQMTYFDRIIGFANKRLMVMSDNQYELVRRTVALDAKSQTGLDLDVIDHYNGCQRPVNTLSGGESFEASLALALGLSDEIVHSASGIKIDTMFVDEGFGTLDSDSIQKAYQALSSITEGDKIVGIISHVDYLKEKIDKKIEITKARNGGSTAKVIV